MMQHTTENTVRHTPGPWAAECEDKRSWIIRSDDYGGVALVHDPYANSFERFAQLGANARLIAAAPDLLNALRLIVHESLSGAPYAVDRIRGLANETIAQADGRS